MYDHNSVLIAGLLLATLIIAAEIGTRLGRRYRDATNESTKSHISGIQGSILGVLALLLGFTFSLSLQRYDTRSEAVINEANAIGTAMLRASLIPESVREESRTLLRNYLDLRIKAGAVSLDREDERDQVLLESNRVLDKLWANAVRAADENPSPVQTGLYVQALNEAIDAFGSRDAALARHVPELVLFLMFGTLILTAALVGFASGVGGHRASFAAYTLLALIVCLVFVIIDLDRPRRGLIEVTQVPLLDLRSSSVFAAP